MIFLLIFLKISVFLSNVVAISITIQPDTLVGEPSLVLWTREPGDGNGKFTFDLRFVQPGDEDVGLALANVQASPSAQFGTVQVVFPSPGSYELVAVSGPDATDIGTSNQVNAFAVSTTSASPSHTSASQPISSATTVPVLSTPTASEFHHKKNVGAIVGGTLGGVAFLGLLAALAILCLRRRQSTGNRRWTFHRDMMIRPENANASAITIVNVYPTSPTPTITQSSSPPSPDVEQGLPHDTSPSEVVLITSPNGSAPLNKPRPLPIPPSPLTDRQQAIANRIEELRDRMTELERNAGPTQHIILDDMQKQMSWLQDQIGSAWAMGLTDVTPLGFSYNLKH